MKETFKLAGRALFWVLLVPVAVSIVFWEIMFLGWLFRKMFGG